MIGVLGGQFEHAIEKYRCINDNCVAMFASNNALMFDDILSRIDRSKPILQIAEDIHKVMVKIRLEKIDKEILKAYDVDWTFVKQVLDKQLMNTYVDQILNKITNYNLASAMLLIGFEKDEAQIYEITEVGFSNLRSINFGVIGSGFQQASNALLFQKHSKKDKLETAIYNVYKAKKNSEVSQGVGKETDLLVLFNSGGLKKTEERHIKKLEEIYQLELNNPKTNVELSVILGELI